MCGSRSGLADGAGGGWERVAGNREWGLGLESRERGRGRNGEGDGSGGGVARHLYRKMKSLQSCLLL